MSRRLKVFTLVESGLSPHLLRAGGKEFCSPPHRVGEKVTIAGVYQEPKRSKKMSNFCPEHRNVPEYRTECPECVRQERDALKESIIAIERTLSQLRATLMGIDE